MTILRAEPPHLETVASLFDRYRVFYGQSPDLDGARTFIAARLQNRDSVILLALTGTHGQGFVQLYPSFSSVSMAPIWILNDLFVAEGDRRQGVARALMNAAAQHARDTQALRLVLSTQVHNHAAQALYTSLGYEKDDEFYHYALKTPSPSVGEER